jgi:hypothetical protein
LAVTVRRRDPLAERIRENILLTGTYDSSNRLFSLPEPAVHDPPNRQVMVRHGTRTLQPNEYQVEESSPGSGLNRVRVLVFSPHQTSRLYADYLAAL